MEDRQIASLLSQSNERRMRRDWDGAIDLARRALSLDPEHPRAHAALAHALFGAKRLHGADIEIGIALVLDGNDPYGHYVAAAIRYGQRNLTEAWRHCAVALDVEAADADTRVLGAQIRMAQNRIADARDLIDEALAIQPEHVDALVELARLHRDQGRLLEAATQIDIALAADPSHSEAHLVAGYISLARGDVADAEEHARFVMQQNPTERDAMSLWTAVKARRNPLLGLWWRFNALISYRGERSQVTMLVGSFFLANIAFILAGVYELDWLERIVYYAWTGFCGYTWIAPSVFRWMLERELGSVKLDPSF